MRTGNGGAQAEVVAQRAVERLTQLGELGGCGGDRRERSGAELDDAGVGLGRGV